MPARLGSAVLGAALLAAAAWPAAAAEKVVICALTFVSSAPLFIAADRGYYADEGLDAELTFFRAAQPVAVGIASGDCDFGVTGFTAGFFNLAAKGALTVIGAQSREESVLRSDVDAEVLQVVFAQKCDVRQADDAGVAEYFTQLFEPVVR